jgi:hypothetical protein
MLSDLPQILGENLVLLVHRGTPSGGIECPQPTLERLVIPACCETTRRLQGASAENGPAVG